MAARKTRTHAENLLDDADLGRDNAKSRRILGGKPDMARGKNPALPMYAGKLAFMGGHRRAGLPYDERQAVKDSGTNDRR